MKTLRKDSVRTVFGIRAAVLKLLLILLSSVFLCESQADIKEKTFTRKSDGKKASGQVFEPSRTITRQNSRRRRSHRHKSTVSSVVVPSLTPASAEKERKTAVAVVKSTGSAPRFGYGSDAMDHSVSVKPVAPVSQPVYIFSPYYNNTQYYPAAPFYHDYYGYGSYYPGSFYSPYGYYGSPYGYYNHYLHHSYSYRNFGLSFGFSY